jgi:hypothetical protein
VNMWVQLPPLLLGRVLTWPVLSQKESYYA